MVVDRVIPPPVLTTEKVEESHEPEETESSSQPPRITTEVEIAGGIEDKEVRDIKEPDDLSPGPRSELRPKHLFPPRRSAWEGLAITGVVAALVLLIAVLCLILRSPLGTCFRECVRRCGGEKTDSKGGHVVFLNWGRKGDLASVSLDPGVGV